MTRELTINDLREAPYNPRSITPLQKEALRKSYVRYGDLSGIIYNRTTKNLIGGHQRISLFRAKARQAVIKRTELRDATGTVAVGFIAVPRDGGGTIRIPYREVEFDPAKEMAANIAANASGGEFDSVKLGRVLRKLEEKKFAIEDTALDSVEIRRALRLFDHMKKNQAGIQELGEFAAIDPEAVRDALEHQCPKCGYEWSGSTKPAIKASAVRRGDGKLTDNQLRIKAAATKVKRRRDLQTLADQSRRNDKTRRTAQ